MNATADWLGPESLALTDAVVTFASLSLGTALVWVVAAESRPMHALARRVLLSSYVVFVLAATATFAALAGKYDIAAHLAADCAPGGLSSCNAMAVALGLACATWACAAAFAAYLWRRPESLRGVLTVEDEPPLRRPPTSRPTVGSRRPRAGARTTDV